MSEYKVGDKFVVEIAEVHDEPFNEVDLYRMKGFNSLVFDKNGLDKLQKYEEEVIATKFYEKGRKEALQEVQNCESYGYEKGLQDAWKLARKIVLDVSKGGIPERDMRSMFGEKWTVSDILKNFTPQETLAKIEAYEKEKEQEEIKVGDVVEDELARVKGVVLKKSHGDKYYILFRDGSAGTHDLEELKKTGKHIDVKNILKQISDI